MGEIKKYYKTGCGSSFCDLVEHKDGNYVLYEDHLKVIAEAKKELFTREQVSEIVDYCFHKHASSYMGKEAEVAIEEAVEKIQGRRVFNIEIIGEEKSC